MKQLLTLGAAAVLFGLGCSAAVPTPVVLELFTSEGCSSCPPADRLLADWDKQQPIQGVELIVLSEHVDYWNRLGWSDPYSAQLFSARQQRYAMTLGIDDIYTPQAVVDGYAQTVGSNAMKLNQVIEKAARQVKIPIGLSANRGNGKIDIHVHWDGAEKLRGPVTVYLALAQNEAQSQVKAGENSGQTLKHVAVARQITEIGKLTANTPFAKEMNVPVEPQWGNSGLRVIVFLQEKTSGKIIGAAQQKL